MWKIRMASRLSLPSIPRLRGSVLAGRNREIINLGGPEDVEQSTEHQLSVSGGGMLNSWRRVKNITL